MLAVENLSRLENENLCTLANISCRRFLAKPAEAVAALRPAKKASVSEESATSTSTVPMRST